MTSIYANLLEQKKAFTEEKSSTPTGLVWDTNMASMTSCESTESLVSSRCLQSKLILTFWCKGRTHVCEETAILTNIFL